MRKTLKSDLMLKMHSSEHLEWKLSAQHELNYEISFQQNLFNKNNQKLAKIYAPTFRVLIFIDSCVYSLYGKIIEEYFLSHDIEFHYYCLTAGEDNKSILFLQEIIDKITLFSPLRRKEPILAIGGGVITDVVGFAASIYKRGIPFIRIPTTLMGMIDAAIGVKCGINYGGKNLLGSYHVAENTFIDPMFIWTLPEIHIRNGIAEMLKMGIIASKDLFILCQEHLECFFEKSYNLMVKNVMQLAIEKMLEALSANFFEFNLQRSVDFGHTWSPAIELSTQPLLHGYAVNVDMAFSLCIARTLNLIDASSFDDVISVMKRAQLPLKHPLMSDMNFLINTIKSTKIHRDGALSLPLPNGVGECVFINDLDEKCLRDASHYYSSL